MGKKITDYLLYRWRYIIGYSIIGLTIVALLVISLFVPGGLSASEMDTVVKSSDLTFSSLDSFNPASIINLPYNILQRASIELLGLSIFSIKLPSLILGALSTVGMILLLQMWFKRNVAVLTTVLVITTGQFLFVAQSGTPSIVYIFWSVWLLVAAMMVSRKAAYLGFWKIILFSFAALSLYTPLSAYILIALASAIVFHPHLRYLTRQVLRAKSKVLLAVACALLIITPLIYFVTKDPSVGLALLGIPESLPNIIDNAKTLLKQYFDFSNPGSGTFMTPVYGLGSMVLIVLGIIRLASTKYTARSYIISAWTILLLPVILINPGFSSITFVPAMLLMAMGISSLLRSWYQLFPRNPYARIAGLFPLTILIGGMFISGVDRYMYGYLYDPNISTNFSHDLRLVSNQLDRKDRTPTTIVVSKDEVAFYEVLASHRKDVTISTTSDTTLAVATIVSHAAYHTGSFGAPNGILTDDKIRDADRFYLYNTDQK